MIFEGRVLKKQSSATSIFMGPKCVMMSGGHILKKCRIDVDMISKLPDDVLVRILSFLKLNEAATTSLLSHRWLHLWKHTPKLIFKNHKLLSRDPQIMLRYVNWVNSVISLHEGDLQELTIYFYTTKSNHYDVTKWLEFAFSRRVESLEFNWRCLDVSHVSDDALPLEDIILENITLVPSSSTRFQFLKVLRLRQIKTSADAIQFFLRNCPHLERLVIDHAIMSSDLEVVSPSLKYFEIQPPNKNISIKVSAPNLTFLNINYDSRKLFLEDVPKLVHMAFCCRFDNTMHDFVTVASQLETLSIFLDSPKASFSVPEMPKLKKLVVGDVYHNRRRNDPFPVTSFLRASPCLVEFEVKITGLTFEEGVFEVPKVGPVFKHSSLERFKLLWFCGEQPCEDRIKLVRYIVGSCVALEEIYISQCDGKKLGQHFYVVVDCCVRVATSEERAAFEKTIQLQLPAHIKLRVGNHSHKSPYNSSETTCPHVSCLANC